MTDQFATPDDLGEIRQSELHASLGERLGAQALDTLDPKNSLSGMWLVRRAREAAAGGEDLGPGAGGELDVFSGQSLQERQAVLDRQRAAIPDTSIGDAKARVKQEGLDGHLKLPDQPTIKSPVLDLMIQEAHERRDREAAIERGPQGLVPGALGLVTSLGVGMIDPVNAAAFSIPVLGEARAARMITAAGDSIATRAGTRAVQGGLQGAVGTAVLQPADWWLHTRDGQDYTMADALKSVVMGAGMGAALHAGIGGFKDVRARMRGAPLEGSPEEQVLHGLMAGHDRAPAGVLDDVAAGQLDEPPLPSVSPYPPEHPAHVLADLPPAAQEDVVRAAIADITQDHPVRAAELLQVAADHSPRILESMVAPRTPAQPPLIVARKMPDGSVRYGEMGQIHADLVDADASPLSVSGDQMGFARPNGEFLSRDEATRFLDDHHPEISTKIDGIRDGAVRQIEAGQYNRAINEIAGNPKIVLGEGPATTTAVEAKKPRGRAAAHPDTFSLNEHLASKGGLRPDPELEAIYGDSRGPFVPGFGPLIRKGGMSLDEALSSAKQHGYLFDAHDIENGSAGAGGRTSHGLTPNDLLDHLDAENRGQKLYKPTHVEKTRFDPEQEKHVVLSHVEQAFEEAGHKVDDIDPKLLARTVEIVHREAVTDVLDAYERAIMEDEERYNAIADARRSNPAAADIPGFGDGDVARTAPGDGGRDQAGDRQAGRSEQDRSGPNDPQSRGDGQRPSAASDPRWRELGDVRPAFDDPAAVEESRAADHVEEPASLVPEKALTAAEKAAADAEAVWRKLEPTLTEDERKLVNDVLDQLKLDKDVRDKIISDGAACLAAAVM